MNITANLVPHYPVFDRVLSREGTASTLRDRHSHPVLNLRSIHLGFARLGIQARLSRLFGLPIVEVANSVLPSAYLLVTENCYGVLPICSKLFLSVPSTAEWLLLFTTLRLMLGRLLVG